MRLCPTCGPKGGGRILQLLSEGGQIGNPDFSLYHATKWGIEGFVEAVAQEVPPFHIEFTLVEPGPAKTNCGARLVLAPAMAAYEHTPAGERRRTLETNPFPLPGDPPKMVPALLDSGDRHPAPKRLTLRSGAYTQVRAALLDRLAVLDAGRAKDHDFLHRLGRRANR